MSVKNKTWDVVLPGEVERRYGAILTAVATEIRARHYSYRTETTYLDWVRRFIAFHAYQDPRELNTARCIREYLEYLAGEREVAASTHRVKGYTQRGRMGVGSFGICVEL